MDAGILLAITADHELGSSVAIEVPRREVVGVGELVLTERLEVSGTVARPANSPRRVIAADFDGDGKIDLCVASVESRNIALLWNSGSGAFEPTLRRDLDGKLYGLAAGDLDGDNDFDLVLTGGSHQVWALRNEGSRQLAEAVAFATGEQPNSVLAADWNSDGRMDLAVTSTGSDSVTVLLGDGRKNNPSIFARTRGGQQMKEDRPATVASRVTLVIQEPTASQHWEEQHVQPGIEETRASCRLQGAARCAGLWAGALPAGGFKC